MFCTDFFQKTLTGKWNACTRFSRPTQFVFVLSAGPSRYHTLCSVSQDSLIEIAFSYRLQISSTNMNIPIMNLIYPAAYEMAWNMFNDDTIFLENTDSPVKDECTIHKLLLPTPSFHAEAIQTRFVYPKSRDYWKMKSGISLPVRTVYV